MAVSKLGLFFCAILVLVIAVAITVVVIYFSGSDTPNDLYSTTIPNKIGDEQGLWRVPPQLEAYERLLWSHHEGKLVQTGPADVYGSIDDNPNHTNNNNMPPKKIDIVKPISKVEKKMAEIPHHIIHTFRDECVPHGLWNAINSILVDNPGFSYNYYTNKTCREFIIDHFGDDDSNHYLHAFDLLKPGAYKADVFRLCAMFVTGGVYMDTSMCAYKGPNKTDLASLLSSIPEGVEQVVVPDLSDSGSGCYQAFIVSVPGSAAIKYILDGIVQRVLNLYVPTGKHSVFKLTGPIAFRELLNEYYGYSIESPLVGDYKGYRKSHPNQKFTHGGKTMLLEFYCCRASTYSKVLRLFPEGPVLVKTKYKNWRNDRSSVKSKHYTNCRSMQDLYNIPVA